MKLEEPVEASLIGLRIAEATVLETVAEIKVRIENENPQALQLSGAVHKIYLNDVYLGKGMTSEPMTVEGLSSNTQILRIYLRNLSLASRLRSIMESQAVTYEMKTTLHLDTDEGSSRLRTASTGRLDLKDFTP